MKNLFILVALVFGLNKMVSQEMNKSKSRAKLIKKKTF